MQGECTEPQHTTMRQAVGSAGSNPVTPIMRVRFANSEQDVSNGYVLFLSQ